MSETLAPIRVRELRKTYRGAVRALKGVSLTIAAARITGLIGPNGAGKSTLIHSIAGLVGPDSGTCEIFGVSSHDRRARMSLGLLPEEVSYEAGLRLDEILRVHWSLAGRVGLAPEEALALVGLELPLSRRISRCSLGQARRVALACALVGRPRLLILDEPTSGMDVPARERLFAFLEQFRRDGGTVLLSSHMLSDIERLCDDIAILQDGRIVCAGELSALLRTGRTEVRIAGVSVQVVTDRLGPDWDLRDEGATIVAATDRADLTVSWIAQEIEAAGGSVIEMTRGSSLLDVYRSETEQ